jgi:hypothetical protein
MDPRNDSEDEVDFDNEQVNEDGSRQYAKFAIEFYGRDYVKKHCLAALSRAVNVSAADVTPPDVTPQEVEPAEVDPPDPPPRE